MYFLWRSCPRLRVRDIARSLCAIITFAVPALVCAVAPDTQQRIESPAIAVDRDALLSLAAATQLALIEQPQLIARQADIDAQMELAVAVGQLPDPKLSTGLRDVPINTREAFSLRRDNFTELTVGVSQEIPRANKRRLLSERKTLEADVDRAALSDDRRRVQRDAALAWLDVYAAEQAYRLAHAVAATAVLQVQSVANAYRNGKAAQADWLAAKVEVGVVNDRVQDWLHHVAFARAELGRWIGANAAARPLAGLPEFASPAETSSPQSPSLAASPTDASQLALLQRLNAHPLLLAYEKQTAVAMTDIALAKQRSSPDVSIEGYVAYRQDFADFVGLQISVDLPLFRHDRQDRELAAAQHYFDASTERKQNALRKLNTELQQGYVDWQHYGARARTFAEATIPDAQLRIAAASGAYAAGRGNFDAVLQARRGLLDVQLQRLALVVESARAATRLQYLVGEAAL